MMPNYLICTTPRSGSALLGELLARTGVCGRPAEFFGPTEGTRIRAKYGLEDAAFDTFVEHVRAEGSTENGVFGAKVLHSHLAALIQGLTALGPASAERPVPLRSLLEGSFPGVRTIWLRRRDTVAQAVSHRRALVTGAWSSTVAGNGASAAYDFAMIEQRRSEFVLANALWEKIFATTGLFPIELWYEDFADPDHHDDVTRSVLEALGIPAPTPLFASESVLRRQRAHEVDPWVAQYWDDLERTAGSVGPLATRSLAA